MRSGLLSLMAVLLLAGSVRAQSPAVAAKTLPPKSPAVAAPKPLVKAQPRKPAGAITALAVSGDGKRVAVGTFGQVVVYDTANQQPVATFREVKDGVRSLAFHPDNVRLAIGSGLPSRSGEVVVWNIAENKVTGAYPVQRDTIEAVTFAPDGKALLFGSNDNRAVYYATLGLAGRSVLDEHNGRVDAVAVSPRPDFVFLTGGMDRIVKVWDRQHPHTVANFDQSEAGITGLAFINENQFVGSSLDGRLYWWGVDFNAKKQTWGGYHFRTVGAHDGGVYALNKASATNRIITCGADGRVKVWNTDGGFVREFKDTFQTIYAVALSPDGKLAFGGGREGLLYVWEVDTGKTLLTLTLP